MDGRMDVHVTGAVVTIPGLDAPFCYRLYLLVALVLSFMNLTPDRQASFELYEDCRELLCLGVRQSQRSAGLFLLYDAQGSQASGMDRGFRLIVMPVWGVFADR